MEYTEKHIKEIEKIRAKYVTGNEGPDGYEKIKELDASTMRGATVVAIIVGVLGCLILGIGLGLIFVWNEIVLGILIGILGLLTVLAAYPIYAKLVQIARKKVKFQMLYLCSTYLSDM